MTIESPRFHFENLNGPVPTGAVASALTPLAENIAPILVVIRNSQSLLGLDSVTCNCVGDGALASATTSIARCWSPPGELPDDVPDPAEQAVSARTAAAATATARMETFTRTPPVHRTVAAF